MEVCLHTPGEFVSNIFTIQKKSGRNRPVIDMIALNEFVECIPFRMEDTCKNLFSNREDKTRFKGHISNCPSGQKSRMYLCFV